MEVAEPADSVSRCTTNSPRCRGLKLPPLGLLPLLEPGSSGALLLDPWGLAQAQPVGLDSEGVSPTGQPASPRTRGEPPGPHLGPGLTPAMPRGSAGSRPARVTCRGHVAVFGHFYHPSSQGGAGVLLPGGSWGQRGAFKPLTLLGVTQENEQRDFQENPRSSRPQARPPGLRLAPGAGAQPWTEACVVSRAPPTRGPPWDERTLKASR